MTTRVFFTSFLATALALATPRAAQLGSLGSAFGKAQKIQEVRKDLIFTDAEEEQLGSQISQKLRDKYGVVQDKAIHKYVTLVGTVLAQASSRPNLKWTFIVLDTDGINAFAAPGGYVHITRGALALLKNESELGDVLGHEISHVTQKHTIKAIQKANVVSLGAQATRQDVLNQAADSGYQILFQNGFDRKDEMEADELGVKLANSVGYSPTGLGAFLSRLADRDKGLTEPSGLFASHPDTEARLDGLKKVIASNKLTAAAIVEPRFVSSVTFKPTPVDAVPQVGTSAPAAAKTADSSSSGSSGKGMLGLGGMSGIGREKSSSSTISSAGSRGVNPDRDAKGGPVKTLVAVSVTSAEVAEFRKGIAG